MKAHLIKAGEEFFSRTTDYRAIEESDFQKLVTLMKELREGLGYNRLVDKFYISKESEQTMNKFLTENGYEK